MKKSTKVVLSSLLAGVLSLGGVYAISEASAQNNGNWNNSSLAERISNKFGINREELNSVFEEQQQEKRQAMTSKLQKNLDQLVKDGKITEEKKGLINQKHEELQKQHEEWRNDSLTREDRQAKMQQEREALKTWAEQNDINPEYLPMGSRGMGKGFGRGMGKNANCNCQTQE